MADNLTDELYFAYLSKKEDILSRLEEFKNVPESQYFYEACYCILTPQSKAKNADLVVNKLIEMDFQNNDFNPVNLLEDKNHYIRFHNTKAERLSYLKEVFPEILNSLKSNLNNYDKRLIILSKVSGYGLKESSHFMRNIGYRNLAILDRHILRNLVKLGIYKEIPKINPNKNYFAVEETFLAFAKNVNISIDELDLLFFSEENGEILK